jgi:RNA polymerase sigma-70 factor, ECF subfamily
MTDLELLRRFRSGDEAAFHELVDRHANYLYGVAYSLTGNAADAEDVVQETFAGAFRGAGSFREAASIKTWLLRILMRQAARSFRSSWKRKVISLHDGPEQAMEEDGNLAVMPEQDQVDHRTDVLAMLRTLSPEHREVIVLRELEGMSYGEIAAAIGVPQGTVESRLYRARQDLRERFKGYL